ncbi:MAG: trigger factor [Flavobacteriaceae bacterium]
MKISHQELDALNAVLTVAIDRKDFSEKVDAILSDYRKKANIPGFRKGHVPMGMIKKQYETAVTADEVNKLLQENLDKYLKEQAIDILGNPLPKAQDQLDWKADQLNFEFELGLAPKFEIDLKSRKKVTQYIITAEDKMIDEQISQIQKQYGKLVAQKEIKTGYEITGHFFSEALEIDTTSTFTVDQIKGKKNTDALKAAKNGAALELETKNLFEEAAVAQQKLGISADQAKALKGPVTLTIKEINERVLAKLDQELFDKLYEPGTVTSVKQLKEKIRENIEKQFEQQSDQKLLNDVTDHLIENTQFDLPEVFLKKWLQTTSKEPLTEEQAAAEYDQSVKGIRYQLIEGKIIADHNLQLQFEELKTFAKSMIVRQMAQYGQLPPEDKQLDEIVARVMTNQEETRRLSEQLISSKLLEFYKENAPLKAKKVTFGDFIKEAYSQG